MPKHYNFQTKYFKDNNGVEHRVDLLTTKTRDYTTEHASCYLGEYGIKSNEVEGKYKWCNRPWQTFTYCGAMEAMIEKLPKEWRENATLRLIKNEEERITKKCDEFLDSFQKNYDKLSDGMKQSLAEHAPMIETQEQAEAAAAMVGLFAALGM
jgi:hypothetical protein